MAKAYLRNDSQYVWITFSHKGKRYRKKTKYEASEKNVKIVEKDVLPVLMAKIRTGEVLLEKDKSTNNKFEYYSKLFLKTKRGLRPNSYKQYCSQIEFWDNHFKDRDIKSIKASEIKEILFSLQVEVSTLRDLLGRLKAVFDEAEIDDVIKINPAKKIKLPRAEKKQFLPFSREEVSLLLNNTDDYFKCYLAVGFYTGMRTGEILALKWQNINLAKRLIYVDATVGQYEEQATKTLSSTRYVPIFEPLIPFLKEQQKRTGLKKYVFCTKTGQTMQSTNLINHRWKPLLKRLHLPYRRLYETRHTFATNMISSNKFNLNQIACWLGHSSIQTLISKYNKYIPSEIAKFDKEFDVFDTKNVTKENDTLQKYHKLGSLRDII